jgi:antirestriction protein ArdC
MKTDCVDIHQHITDKIVSAIERGAGEFRLPWHRSTGNIMRPVNIASKKAYRGVNVVALWAYSSGVWGTYKQWAEAGAQVRRGEKAAFVVFYKEFAFAADNGHPADRASRGFRRRDRRIHSSWRRPGLLSPVDGQHSSFPSAKPSSAPRRARRRNPTFPRFVMS